MKNTITPIDRAFAEMIDAGLPIEEFRPNEKTGEFDFVFSRDLSSKELKTAKKIIKSDLGDIWKFSYFKSELQ